MNDLQKMGTMLKEFRLNKNLSLRKLSELTGISFSHLSKIERGQYKPSRLNLMEIGNNLEIPLTEMNAILLLAEYSPYGGDDVRKQINNVSDIDLEKREQEIIEMAKIVHKSYQDLLEVFEETKNSDVKPKIIEKIKSVETVIKTYFENPLKQKNNEQVTKHLLDEEAAKLGVTPDDPLFINLVNDAISLIKIARNKGK